MVADNSFVYVINAEHSAKWSVVHTTRQAVRDSIRECLIEEDPRLWWSADTTDGLSSAAVIDCAEQDAAQELQLEHFTACICRAFTTVLGAPGDTNSCVSGRSQTLLHFLLYSLASLVTVSSVTNEAIVRRK